MSKRAVILFSTFFGLAAMAFALIAVNSVALGPDPAHPSAAQMAARAAAANKLQHQIDTVRVNTPPALPDVSQRISVSASGATAATPVPVVVPTSTPAPSSAGRAPVAGAPGTDDPGEYYGDEGTSRDDDHGVEAGDQSDD